jgi:hypothetical protein
VQVRWRIAPVDFELLQDLRRTSRLYVLGVGRRLADPCQLESVELPVFVGGVPPIARLPSRFGKFANGIDVPDPRDAVF